MEEDLELRGGPRDLFGRGATSSKKCLVKRRQDDKDLCYPSVTRFLRSHRASSSSNDGSSTSSSSSSESGSDSSATRRKKKKKKRKKRRKQKKREKEARKELARIETTREESLEEGEAQSDDDVWKDIMAGGDRQAGSPIAPTDAHPDAAESEVDPEKKVVTESVELPPAALPKVVKKEPARSPVASSTPPETVSTPPTTAVRSEILDAGTIGSPLKEVVAEKDKEPEEEGEIEGGEEEEIPLDEHGQPIPEFRGWSKTEEDLKRIERALDEYEAKVKAEEKERQEIVVPEGSFQKEERVRQTMEEYTQRLQELELSVENFKGQIFRMAVRDEEQGSRLVELEEGFNKFRREIFKYKETLNTELEEEFREHAEENPVILEAMDRVDELVKRSRKSKDSMMTLKRFYEAKREELTLKAESSKKKVEEVVKEPPPKEPEVEEKMETEVLEQETAQVPEQETDEVPEQETDQVPVQEAKESKPEESPLSPEKEPVEAKEERKSNSPVATQKQAGEEDTTELPEAFTTIDEVTEDVDETTADAESIPASVDASPAPSALLDENSATGDGTSDIPDDAGEGTVVEPSKEDDLTNLTWASRWVTSEKVKKVVSASKIFSKVRKKFKTEKKQQSAAASPASSSPQVGMSASGAVSSTYSSAKKRPTLTFGNITGSLHQNFEEVGSVVGPSSAVTVKEEPQEHHKTHLPTVIGSIEEYERLFGKHVKMEHEKKPDEESKEKGKEEKQKKADGEDSEEEDLWSQIMGGDDSD
ncbi:unnamed protein product [Cyprideis torosa]|uniref:Uncharacterized protein n=1 Tax=Cyprideis torosa TaxID=163714 RepID=A0A7R8ZLB3_9CRUS|nr:unnamed protein product [Cyprideis torosa]CAG0883253.1 unnamed protein product [Cyprideis torosa]